MGLEMSWNASFDVPVLTPEGKTLRTLEDARAYVHALPQEVLKQALWQTALTTVTAAGDRDEPTDVARTGLMQALYPGRMRMESTGFKYRQR
jgi:hypothetical protein